MRRPRHLSPDERALWDKVARRTTPLDDRNAPQSPLAVEPSPKRVPARAPLPGFVVGSQAPGGDRHDTLSPLADRLRAKPLAMDAKSFGRMSRGKLKPEAKIDLHGMTTSEAHPELTAFILRAVERGRRLVLVITGKGRRAEETGPIPVRHGVLRHQVPQWLALPPLAPLILEVRPAHQRHGGEGAYYVYLRRRR